MELQRRVRFAHEDLDAVRMTIRTDTDVLTAGVRIEVELGGRWISKNGQQERVGGLWVHCEVISDSSRELVMKLVH